MSFIIGLLTAFMVLDCLVLILLVLMQLPKKEAGAGLAFGGAATDALFGAGSGNFLTKATKYAAIIFFAFSVVLSIMQNSYAHAPGSKFRRELEEQQKALAAAPAPPTAPGTPMPEAPGTNAPLVLPVPAGSTNFPLLVPPAGVPTNATAPK